jgi:hypothetical protein
MALSTNREVAHTNYELIDSADMYDILMFGTRMRS